MDETTPANETDPAATLGAAASSGGTASSASGLSGTASSASAVPPQQPGQPGQPRQSEPKHRSSFTIRLRQLTTPWWRMLWLIGGIIWAAAFNIIYVSTGGSEEWWGVVSIIPIALLLVDILRRERVERAAAQKRANALKG